MFQPVFPVIDPVATGRNILRLRKERGLTVKDLQAWFGFEEPQAIYKWQRGESLPCVDNLYALGALFGIPMDDILIAKKTITKTNEQQAMTCCSYFCSGCVGYSKPCAVFTLFVGLSRTRPVLRRAPKYKIMSSSLRRYRFTRRSFL